MVEGELREGATDFDAALRAGDAERTVAAAAAYGEAMARLGAAAGLPIVEDRLAHIAALAAEAGGAAKPSGAGGGDVAVAFFASESAAQRFERACATRPFARSSAGAALTHPRIVDAALGGAGVAPLAG